MIETCANTKMCVELAVIMIVSTTSQNEFVYIVVLLLNIAYSVIKDICCQMT